MLNIPDEENQPDWNKIKPLKEKYAYFALGYFSATVAWFIVWLLLKIK